VAKDGRTLIERKYGVQQKGFLCLQIHSSKYLSGGIIEATAQYVHSEEAKFDPSTAETEDVLHQMRMAVKNGFLVLQDHADLKQQLVYSDHKKVANNSKLKPHRQQ
jgi:hypothetical protein